MHLLRLLRTARVIPNIELLLNLGVKSSRTSSGMDEITLWSSMYQINVPRYTIYEIVSPTLVTLFLILLRMWNSYHSLSPLKIIPYKLLWEIYKPTQMESEVILKNHQATSLKLTYIRYLQNLIQQNQTPLKFQQEHFPDEVKPEWTFNV